jgi:16S rRNA (uracil1498-N3)-methyltransferase
MAIVNRPFLQEKTVGDRHQFAIYYKNLSGILVHKNSSQYFEFKDKELSHRLTRVLRVRSGSKIVLFDEQCNACVSLLDETFTKKDTVVVAVESVGVNRPVEPYITLMPCLLKKDAFEEIIYAAAQMGVNKVIPVLSEKVQRSWLEERDFARLSNIMIAACEQSKNFVIPELCKPIAFENLSDLGDSFKIYFDPAGIGFVDLLNKLQASKPSEITLFFGPEGGLTEKEEKVLVESGFMTCALTPTILRAREAVIVGLGGVRSLSNGKVLRL